MSLFHWNYFLALEDDVEKLSRYIEFSEDNFPTYSLENARIIMSATQEIDILLKQLCAKNGNTVASDEEAYRKFIPVKYPKLLDVQVGFPRHDIGVIAFENWKNGNTPKWWTANNKIKHERHTEFKKASLENVLEAIGALFLINIYFYFEVLNIKELYPNPKLLHANELIIGVTPTSFGNLNVYKLP